MKSCRKYGIIKKINIKKGITTLKLNIPPIAIEIEEGEKRKIIMKLNSPLAGDGITRSNQ
jgi:hypothetical protein